jgi:hypothetical protein
MNHPGIRWTHIGGLRDRRETAAESKETIAGEILRVDRPVRQQGAAYENRERTNNFHEVMLAAWSQGVCSLVHTRVSRGFRRCRPLAVR